jgi:hypothetical protein
VLQAHDQLLHGYPTRLLRDHDFQYTVSTLCVHVLRIVSVRQDEAPTKSPPAALDSLLRWPGSCASRVKSLPEGRSHRNIRNLGIKLIKAHATNFRSIEDSNEFEISQLARLVGKNEAGK